MTGQRALPPTEPAGRSLAVCRRRLRFGAALVSAIALAALGAVATAAGEASTTPPPGPPDDLGDDPELDELAQACFDGDLVACDHLYLQSPVGSDYEAYGDTCGGRQEAATGEYCGLGAGPPTDPGVSGDPTPPEDLGTDPELDALAESCYVGDMQACDDLYSAAPSASDYQVYGDTCAGRQAEGTGRYCTALEDPVPGTDGAVTTVPETTVPETTAPVPTVPETTAPVPTVPETTAPVTTAPVTTAPVPTAPVPTAPVPTAPETTAPVPTAPDATRPTSTLPAVTLPAPTVAPPEPVDTTEPSAPETTEPPVADQLPPATEEPTDLGDDPALDELAGLCFDGDMRACDDLYDQAEPGSAYREFADTCAGRQSANSGVWCADAFPADATATTVPETIPSTEPLVTTEPVAAEPTEPVPSTEPPVTTEPVAAEPTEPPVADQLPPPTEEPIDLGDDPALDELAGLCFDGDMRACDDLYDQAEPGSAYREFADTCAGRQPANSGVWCADAFPADVTSTTVPETIPPTEQVDTVPPTEPVEPVDTMVAVPGTIPPPTIEPTGLGTDPALDELAQQCFDGDMVACDDLWLEAELEPTYRDYGDTCAGRQEPVSGTWCEEAFPADDAPPITEPAATTPTEPDVADTTAPPGPTTVPDAGVPPATQEPTDLGDDPALDELAEQCFDGAMQACDDLFDASAIGSEYQQYGDTCAGRQPAGTFNYCRVAFPDQ